MKDIFIKKCFVRSLCLILYNINTRFGAEGRFMRTWHDFGPEFKPRRSRKRLIKMLTNRGKDWKKTKMKEKKQFENATNLGGKKKIGNRKKNSTQQEN